MKNAGKGIGSALLSLAFVFCIAAATSSTAQAQYRNDNGRYRRDRNWDNYGRDRYDRYNNSQVELNRGYQYGLNTGASDAQRGQSFSPQRSRYYQQASSQAFLQGFVQGYNEGYRQYARNSRYRRSNNSGNILDRIFGRP